MTIHTTPFPPVEITDKSVTERVFEGLEHRLDAVVLTDGASGLTLTAGEFMDRVKRLAGGLQKANFAVGKTVALMAPNLPEYCVIFHGVAWAGGTITTLNPTYTAPEIAHQLADSNADLLITVPDFMSTAEAAAGDRKVVAIGTPEYEALFSEPLKNQEPIDLDSHVLALPYSSGTTGLPKGVMLSHRNLVVNIDQAIAGGDFRPGEVAAAFLPFFHIYGMTVLMNVHLASEGALVTMPRFDLPMFLKINQDYKSRRMWVVPPVALALAKQPEVDNYDLSSIEAVFVAAAPAGAELSDAVSERLNCKVLQGYGMTELSPVSHLVPFDAPRSGAAGIVISNTTSIIADPETGKALPPGSEGEVWVKGPQIMLGYLNNPEATRDMITDEGWLRTGDIGYVDGDGYLFIVDRLKELIKYKGFQVAPAELEAALISMDEILDAAVIGLPNEEAGELPIAFVVRSDPSLTEDRINAYFSENLATYKQLHQIRFVDEVPKSASGKILRRFLRDQVAAETA